MKTVKLMLMAALAVLLIMPNVAKADDGFTLWGLMETDIKSSQTAVGARLGYRIDNIEPFIGYTAWPDYESEIGEVEPPDVLSLGAVVHFQDLLDPANPIPLIPDVLRLLIPEGWVAFPYTGGQATWHIGKTDGGFYSGMIGIKVKQRLEDQSALVFETGVSHGFDDLSQVQNDWGLRAGIYIPF